MNNRTLAVDHIQLLNTTGYDNMIASFSTSFDLGKLLESLFYGVFGSYFDIGYLLLFGAITYLMYHDHKSLLAPTVMILIFGKVMFSFIPESVTLYLELIAMVGMTAVLVKLYRDGRQ